MLNYFKDLTLGKKIGFVCLVVAGFWFVVTLIINFIPSGEAKPEPTASNIVTSAPSATHTPTETASASASATATASGMPEIKYGENKIPVSEIRDLQGVANKGLIEFLTWNASENKEARDKRIAPYFSTGSKALTLAPDLRASSSYVVEGGKAGMVSLGDIDYINPVGGDEKLYRLTMGTVLRAQYNYAQEGNEKSSVVQTSMTLTVDMTKESGEWKIKTLSEE